MEKLMISIMYQGEAIESRLYNLDVKDAPKYIPTTGDKLHIVFQNEEVQKEHGSTWKVNDRVFFMYDAPTTIQAVQLYCEPWKPDESYDI